MAIEIKSFNQILGNMIRKIVAETPVSDINPGSVFLSLLEACASNDFENNVAILNVLELLSVDSIRNNDLDNKAADFGLSRRPAVPASGVVTIYNTNIKKQSTSLYSLKPAPIAGQTVIYVTDTKGWSPTGSLYIGRGTTSFEGPIPYINIQTFATYSQVTLGAALQRDHLISDTVVNAQGQPDRRIPAGTVVKIPANNQNAEITYVTVRDAVIPAGEDKVENVLVMAQVPGTRGNALINTIRQFAVAPFIGAAVTNTQAFTSGADVETDAQLRNRIKSYAASLARGTSSAILTAVLGLSDPDENKRVASATLTNPVSPGSPSILYIDDGSGFQPSYAGQAVDVLVARANGTEEFLQLANYPLPRPQVTNTASGPFTLTDGMFFRVAIDGEEDVVVFEASDFVNITVATVSEVVSAINAKSTLFKARLDKDSNHILIYPVDPDAETLQVVPLRENDDESLYANNILNFPTREVSYIALYQNSTRLHQRAKRATVQTVPFASWNLLSDGNLIISVDGTPGQNGVFTLADFPGSTSYSLLTLEDWARAVNAKFAGITAVATPSQTLQITSNKVGSGASISILGGSYKAAMFATNSTVAVGQESQFEINRQSGNIRLLTEVTPGDTISAGVVDAKGYVVSTPTTSGFYNLDIDEVGRKSELVIVADATKCDRIPVNFQVGDTIQVTKHDTNVMRLMASTVNAFKNVLPGHYVYLALRNNWLTSKNTGLFHVISRGEHLTAGTDTWIEVYNVEAVAETVTVVDIDDIVVFDTDAYPQIWRSDMLTSPSATTLADFMDSFNKNLSGIRASLFRTTSVKLTSATENEGSIAVPVAVGRIAGVVNATTQAKVNNQPLVASKVPQRDMVGFPKLADVESQNAYLGRAAYSLADSTITTNVVEASPPYVSTYSEEVKADALEHADPSDVLLFTNGDNKGLIRSIAAKLDDDKVGTQHGTPRTLFNHVINDRVVVMQSLRFASDDNIVFVMDGDPTTKTVDISLARNGKVNAGSGLSSFIPTNTEFSADDVDGETDSDFSSPNAWDTTTNRTDFSDYAILMRARNWYASGGTESTDGKFVIRAVEYGKNGEKIRFNMEYPSAPNQPVRTVLTETPSHNLLTYYYGSGPLRVTNLQADEEAITVTNASNGFYDVTFNVGTLASVQPGDVVIFHTGSGLEPALVGQFYVWEKVDNNRIRIYNPDGVTGNLSIVDPSLVQFFPLTGTTVGEIVETINRTNILSAAPITTVDAVINKATRDERYTHSAATALACGHEIGNDSIALYDGVNWVKKFQNANPNFVTKTPFTLTSTGVASSIYALHTAPNEDGTTGELFKLVPTTVKNIQHHFTQKAMSQLPILSDVTLADKGKKVQIVAKKLGSNGAIQVLGGFGNLAQTDILGDTQVVTDTSGSYLLASVAGFPNSYSAGDIVKIQNRVGVRRQSKFHANDTMSVFAPGDGHADYLWDARSTNFESTTEFEITDVSSEYGINPGMIFRWSFTTANGENLANVREGDIVAAIGVSWPTGNLAKLSGSGRISGYPIIKVDEASFDVVCPHGEEMTPEQAIGSGNVYIFPTPIVRWNVAHYTPATVTSISRESDVVTVVCANEHMLKDGDSVDLRDSTILNDGVYGPITVTSPNTFTFADVGTNAVEPMVGATAQNIDLSTTYYRLDVLGVNGLVRLSRSGGEFPRFKDAGVAVDDYIVISGNTFSSLNNGVFRVVAVDNESVVFENPNAVANTVELVPFNKTGKLATWTTNSNIIEGTAGTFKNLWVGAWVKKEEDPDSRYLQVVSFNTGVAATATQVVLGGVYTGISGNSLGVAYDQTNSARYGVPLKNIDDIAFYEGDSVMIGDKLFVQNIAHVNWFDSANTGSHTVVAVGTDPVTHRPFVRVKNPLAVTENNRSMSVNIHGVYLVESDARKFSSYRLIANSTISASDSLRRSLYMLPDSRSYKFSQSNGSYITHTGKLGFDLNTAVGTDGYLYYTGLLRRVQRTIDGYAPDAANFPERRAIGSRIETLPPLIKNLTMALTVTTNQGVTIQDVTNNVKSAVIDYVNSLGVGQDVILSAVIAKVMQVRGVAAVTFNVPAAHIERISVAPNEKAIITADNIGIN